MDGTCDIPGCTNETYMGWRPLTERLGKQICESHCKRHKDPADEFSLFDVFGFKRPAKLSARSFLNRPGRYGHSRALAVKPIVKAEPKAAEPLRETTVPRQAETPPPTPELVQGNRLRCRACGAEREAGHTYCPACGRDRKKEADRERQKRRYWKKQKPHAFARSICDSLQG